MLLGTQDTFSHSNNATNIWCFEFSNRRKELYYPENGTTGALWDLIAIYDATLLPMEDGFCISQWITPPSSPAHHLFPSSRFSHPTTKVPSLLRGGSRTAYSVSHSCAGATKLTATWKAGVRRIWEELAEGTEFPRLGSVHSEHLK